MSIKEIAKKYYPRLWGLDRLTALVEAGKLTKKEFKAITGKEWGAVNDDIS